MPNNSLQLSFDRTDTTGRGCVFVYQSPSNNPPEIYLRALVKNNTSKYLGMARVFSTKLERVEGKKIVVVTEDTFPLNWALMSGANVEFQPGYHHYCDLASFSLGAKRWVPMVAVSDKITGPKTPIYWPLELEKPGKYLAHLLLTGPAIKPLRARFGMKWPLTELPKPGDFSFSMEK